MNYIDGYCAVWPVLSVLYNSQEPENRIHRHAAGLVGGYVCSLTLVGVIWCMNNSLVGIITSNTSNEWQMTLLVRLRSRSFDRRFARMSFEVIRSRPCLLRLSRPLSLYGLCTIECLLTHSTQRHGVSYMCIQLHTNRTRWMEDNNIPLLGRRRMPHAALLYIVCVNRIDVHSGPGRRDGLSLRSACPAPLHLSPIQKRPKTEAG